MKKKNTIRAIIITVIIFELFNLIAFTIPFAHTAAFWFSYGFTYLALGVMAATIYLAFIKNPDAKSRFYGFPLARIGIIYGIAQLIASLLVMTFAKWISGWIPAAVYAIGFGAAAIGLIGAEAVVDDGLGAVLHADAILQHGIFLMIGDKRATGEQRVTVEQDLACLNRHSFVPLNAVIKTANSKLGTKHVFFSFDAVFLNYTTPNLHCQ